jgi:hypothetical protein
MMTTTVTKRLLRSGLTGLSLACTVPASASDWMVIGAAPEPAPHRTVYVMQYGDAWISRRMDEGPDESDPSVSIDPIAALQARTVYTANVLQVFEGNGGTNFVHYQVEFRCQTRLVRIASANAYDRAGKQRKLAAADWMPVPDGWLAKAEMIACKAASWQAASAASNPRGAASSAGKRNTQAPSFASLGMHYLGDFAAWTSVVDAVWTRHWPDAVQPAYTQGTAEDLERSKRAGLAILARAEAIAAEQKKWSGIAIRLSDKAVRQGGQLAGEMANVGGQTEDQVIARWGVPGSVTNRNGVRQLSYYWQGTASVVEQAAVDVIGSTGNGGVGKVGETTKNRVGTRVTACHRTLLLQEGGALETAYRVFDFDVGCN